MTNLITGRFGFMTPCSNALAVNSVVAVRKASMLSALYASNFNLSATRSSMSWTRSRTSSEIRASMVPIDFSQSGDRRTSSIIDAALSRASLDIANLTALNTNSNMTFLISSCLHRGRHHTLYLQVGSQGDKRGASHAASMANREKHTFEHVVHRRHGEQSCD